MSKEVWTWCGYCKTVVSFSTLFNIKQFGLCPECGSILRPKAHKIFESKAEAEQKFTKRRGVYLLRYR